MPTSTNTSEFDWSSLSSDPAAALRTFRQQSGRDPTDDELTQYWTRQGSSGSSSSARQTTPMVNTRLNLRPSTELATFTPVSAGQIMQGATGSTQYDPMRVQAEGARKTTDFSKADEATSGLESIISGLRQANESWMRGEVPGDVADRQREQSALIAQAGGAGVGSQAARNLSARDLGLTSMQIQEAGLQRQGAIAGLQQGLASIREQRSQFMSSMQEQQHQFSAQYGLSAAQAREQSRQFGTQSGLEAQRMGEASRQFGSNLADQVYRTQLAQRELALKQEAFNADMNYRLVELISNSTLAMVGQQVAAAQNDIDMSGPTSSFNNLQSDIQRLINSVQQNRSTTSTR